MTIAGLKSVQQRFLALNHDRLARLEAGLPPRHRVLVEVLALLFHTNHPALPGFVSRDCPCGIAGYAPPRQAIAAAARIARAFDYRRQAPRVYDLHALYLMGSAGTLAYSDRSDFDVWVCHREDLPAEGVAALRRKAEGVSAWAAELGLEVHFFVLTAGDVRRGRHQALSQESSGSAQRHLLLDEFYRTGILLAGRQPLWWFIPPEREREYDAYAAELLRRRFVDPGEVVDFGGVAAIPADEFVGAALWQLYKGVSSPYKALLKILLLETYASEFPEPGLLSSRFKAAVYGGTREVDRLDPYALMLDKVEAYLRQQHDRDRLELARRCLYFKTGLRLGRARLPADDDPRAGQVLALLSAWGWTPAHVQNLDLHGLWKVDRLLEEHQLLVRALTRSYRQLSAFARRQGGGTAISQHDMTVLGRRLFAAFEQRAGKVQWLGQRSPGQLAESHLQLQHVRHDGQEGWLVLRGSGTPESARAQPVLKRAPTLMQALAWCHFNGVATAQTQLLMEDPELAHDSAQALGALRRAYPQVEPSEPSVQALDSPSRPVTACLILNLGVDPLASYTRQGLHLTTERLDPLNYGALEENLCLAVDAVEVSSWHEVFARHYAGGEGLVQCLCEYLGHLLAGPLAVSTHCFTPYRGPSIAQRIQALLEEAALAFAEPSARARCRWLLKVGDLHYAIGVGGDRPVAERIGQREDLLAYLGRPLAEFRDTRFDRLTLPRSVLPAIYRQNAPGRVQVFYRARGASAEVWVLDEHGALFQDTLAFHDESALLNPFARFFDAVQFRQNASGAPGRPPAEGEPVEFYRLVRDEHGDPAPVRLDRAGRTGPQPYLEVRVIAEGRGPEAVRVLCDDLEFSSLEHGPEVFARVAEHVLGLRRSAEPYPVYVTDVDLSALEEPGAPRAPVPTVRYLRYKAEVEGRLNRALAEREEPLRRSSGV